MNQLLQTSSQQSFLRQTLKGSPPLNTIIASITHLTNFASLLRGWLDFPESRMPLLWGGFSICFHVLGSQLHSRHAVNRRSLSHYANVPLAVLSFSCTSPALICKFLLGLGYEAAVEMPCCALECMPKEGLSGCMKLGDFPQVCSPLP